MAPAKKLSGFIALCVQNTGLNEGLSAAASSGTIADLRAILAAGADVQGEAGSNALMSAVGKNRSTFVRALVNAGARDAHAGGLRQETALMIAVNRGLDRCAELLIPHADLSLTNDFGRDVLTEAELFSGSPSHDRIAAMIRAEINIRRARAQAEAIAASCESAPPPSPPKARL